MSTERSPAFQFYPRDFLSDIHVAAMTLQERGAYITLLCLCWSEQSLPIDTKALARICRISTARFARLWPAIEPCFLIDGTRLIQPRLDRERKKQEAYRLLKSRAGKQGGRPIQNGKHTQSTTKAQPKQKQSRTKAQVKQNESTGKANESSSSSSSVFVLQSATYGTEEPPPPALKSPVISRSKRPIFTGQRLVVHEWMVDDCQRVLGDHTDAFDLHEWFYSLDALAVRDGLVIPVRDGGAWLQSQLVAEAQRRGIPLRLATPAAKPILTRTVEEEARQMAADMGLSAEDVGLKP